MRKHKDDLRKRALYPWTEILSRDPITLATPHTGRDFTESYYRNGRETADGKRPSD